MNVSGAKHIAILCPVWNDWAAASELSQRIESALTGSGYTAELWFVDDGSSESPKAELSGGSGLREIHRICLARNYGHQQAIVAGLKHLLSLQREIHGFLLMDGDGEDDPRDIARLVEAASRGSVAVAARGSRKAGTAFQIGYETYKLLFRFCTGQRLEFGNFLYLSPHHARALAGFPPSRLHLASAVLSLGLPRVEVRVHRGARYAGKSRMTALALVRHGLRSIAVAKRAGKLTGIPEPAVAEVQRHFP